MGRRRGNSAGQSTQARLNGMKMAVRDFSESLAIPHEDLRDGKIGADEIFKHLQANSQTPFRIARRIIAGSIGKRTAINRDLESDIQPDYDLVVFINPITLNHRQMADHIPAIIQEFKQHLLHLDGIEERRIRNTTRSLGFTYHGLNSKFEIDLLPAINYTDDDWTQAKIIWNMIGNSPQPIQNIAYNLSSSLACRTVNFIRERLSRQRNALAVIRLAKFWDKSVEIEGYLSGRSYMIELIALRSSRKIKENILKGFEQFLQFMSDLENAEIICHLNRWARHHPYVKAILAQRPLILDPANHYNNLGNNLNDDQKALYKKKAIQTLAKIEEIKSGMRGWVSFEELVQ